MTTGHEIRSEISWLGSCYIRSQREHCQRTTEAALLRRFGILPDLTDALQDLADAHEREMHAYCNGIARLYQKVREDGQREL